MVRLKGTHEKKIVFGKHLFKELSYLDCKAIFELNKIKKENGSKEHRLGDRPL